MNEQQKLLPPFAEKVIQKLQRCHECFTDDQGTDVGRPWLDTLTHLGLLERAQRSPALWQISDAGEEVIKWASARAAQNVSAALPEPSGYIVKWADSGEDYSFIPHMGKTRVERLKADPAYIVTEVFASDTVAPVYAERDALKAQLEHWLELQLEREKREHALRTERDRLKADNKRLTELADEAGRIGMRAIDERDQLKALLQSAVDTFEANELNQTAHHFKSKLVALADSPNTQA